MFDLNLELHSGLKVRGSEINFINKKLLKSKNPRGFVIPVLKVEVTNPRGFFDSSNFFIINKQLALSKQLREKSCEASSYGSLGVCHRLTKQFDKALGFHTQVGNCHLANFHKQVQ